MQLEELKDFRNQIRTKTRIEKGTQDKDRFKQAQPSRQKKPMRGPCFPHYMSLNASRA